MKKETFFTNETITWLEHGLIQNGFEYYLDTRTLKNSKSEQPNSFFEKLKRRQFQANN